MPRYFLWKKTKAGDNMSNVKTNKSDEINFEDAMRRLDEISSALEKEGVR